MWGITNRRGFTLIELMITISIVAILSTVGLNSFISSQKRARDARRQSDLNQFQIALENYASANGGVYPINNANGDASAGSGIFNSTNGALANYLTGQPRDPKPVTGSYDYYFRVDGTGTNWVLHACMEANNSTFYEVCSNGKIGLTNNPAIACSSASVDTTCDVQ